MGCSVFLTESLKDKTREQGESVTEFVQSEQRTDEQIETFARSVFSPDVMVAMAAAAVDKTLLMSKPPEERIMEMLMPQVRNNGPVATTEFIALWLHENPDVMDRMMADERWGQSF